ncbi:response regulator [Maricaulaceae bacterium EIL42A08]|nr:response regulator [Maricaulaceae bacterium EIL42A08]MCP2678668.1 response regulator [Maricaulaceae bacterium NA33B04]
MASLSKVNTLVIDDNAHMINIVRSMLLGFGITKTYESRDAAEAFDIVRHEPIDLIIVDFQMPILDGLEFTQMVRNGGDIKNPYVPIILLTAHTERSRIMAARDAGVTEICAKPVTAHQMWTKIAAVVNNPRPFVRCKTYFGPDRRRKDVEFKGEDRRAPSVDRASKTASPDDELGVDTDTAA